MINHIIPLVRIPNLDARTNKIYKKRRTLVESNFKDLYRFKHENVDFLVREFLPEYCETRGGAVSNVQKMKSFLRYIGDPGFQVGVGEDLGLNQSSISRANWYVCEKITAKAHEWIRFPCTLEEMEKAKRIWSSKKVFPNVIGALDCTHIVIKKPNAFGDEYVNRKNQCSFNVQATCDANYWFTSVNTLWAGSVHDSRIWRNSIIRSTMEENQSGAILLADEGYGITPWVMTPYRNPAGAAQEKFNTIHTRERSIIERCFGQIKMRFPILQSKIRMSTDRIPHLITACFVLHNVAKYLQDQDFGVPVEELIDIQAPPLDLANDNNQKRGVARRELIATYLLDK